MPIHDKFQRILLACGMFWVLAIAAGFPMSADAIALSEEVYFTSDPGVRLAGTLDRPAQVRGPSPVVVFAVGAGPWARGGFVAIRARLTAAGIATLSYDKRGFGQSSGEFDESLPTVARDISAATAYLRSRGDIDPKRIALVGHSQGGGALPLAAAHDGAIAGVVMLAAPIGPRGEVFTTLMRTTLLKSGVRPKDADRVAKATASWLDSRTRTTSGPEVDGLREAATSAFVSVGFTRPQAESAVKSLDNSMVLSMFDAALDKALIQSRAPVLAVYGGADTIVWADYCVPAAAAALQNYPDSLILLVPGMNHSMDRITQAPAPSPGSLPSDGMAPVVVDTVSSWLVQHLR